MKEEDGVWRTVGGRRIFIKDGQSLSDAMKDSGKFDKEETKQEAESNFKTNTLNDGKAKEALNKISEKYPIDTENIDIVETAGVNQFSQTSLIRNKLDENTLEVSIKRQIGLKNDDERGAYHEYAHQMETYWNTKQEENMFNMPTKRLYQKILESDGKYKISLDDYYDRQTTYNSIPTNYLNDSKFSGMLEKSVYDRLEAEKGYTYPQIKEMQSKAFGNGGYSLNGSREFFAEGIATLELEGAKTEFAKVFEDEFKKMWKF